MGTDGKNSNLTYNEIELNILLIFRTKLGIPYTQNINAKTNQHSIEMAVAIVFCRTRSEKLPLSPKVNYLTPYSM